MKQKLDDVSSLGLRQASKPNKIFAPKLILLEVLCSLSISFFPVTAFAGFFDFVADLFAGEIEQELPVHNSQNMPILAAVPNIDPNPVDNIPDLAIADESVLEANVGPMGTPLEIVNENAPDTVIVYIVRQGDTVALLSEMFGVSKNTIIWANGGKTVLKKDDELIILPISGIRYTVKSGDTVAGIAKKFKADAQEIIDFNDIGEGSLQAGLVIIIPDGELTPAAPVSVISGGSSSAASGYFIRPASGRLTQGPHGPRKSAVDIANVVGTRIVAAAAGKVIVAKVGGYNGGYGNYVVIQHNNGMQTLYAHMSSVSVAQGAFVAQGESIGAMGITGKATGSHVHYEIKGGTWGWNNVSK